MSENCEKIREQRVTILERLIFGRRANDSWRVDTRCRNYLFKRRFLALRKRSRVSFDRSVTYALRGQNSDWPGSPR